MSEEKTPYVINSDFDVPTHRQFADQLFHKELTITAGSTLLHSALNEIERLRGCVEHLGETLNRVAMEKDTAEQERDNAITERAAMLKVTECHNAAILAEAESRGIDTRQFIEAVGDRICATPDDVHPVLWQLLLVWQERYRLMHRRAQKAERERDRGVNAPGYRYLRWAYNDSVRCEAYWRDKAMERGQERDKAVAELEDVKGGLEELKKIQSQQIPTSRQIQEQEKRINQMNRIAECIVSYDEQERIQMKREWDKLNAVTKLWGEKYSAYYDNVQKSKEA